MRYIDEHEEEFGVESIYQELAVAPSTYYAAKKRPPPARSITDAGTLTELRRVHQENNEGTYGAEKVWAQTNREGGVRGSRVARCTVERSMRRSLTSRTPSSPGLDNPEARGRRRSSRQVLFMEAPLVLGQQGRLVIPAEVGTALGLAPGDRLHLHLTGRRLILERPQDAAAELRGLAASVPSSRSLVDELLAERRRAAASG